VSIAERAYPEAHSWKASAITDLGWHEVEHGDSAFGIAQLQRALHMYEALGAESGEVLPVLRFLGLAYARQGDLAAARTYFDQGLALCVKQPNPRCALLRANRASILTRLGDALLALAEADQAIAQMATVGWVDTREHAQGLQARAHALRALGRADEARIDLQRVVRIFDSVYGAEHPETRKAQAALADSALAAEPD
jgi:tetratricopeptide (TPR) repeat protein